MNRTIYLSVVALSFMLAGFSPTEASDWDEMYEMVFNGRRIPVLPNGHTIVLGGKKGEKSAIETPLKELITRLPDAPKPNEMRTHTLPEKGSSFHAGKVSPGLVNWLPTYEDTLSASERSRKPVLQFAMIGYLDDRFC